MSGSLVPAFEFRRAAFKALLQLDDREYRHAAAKCIRLQEEVLRKRREETEHSLNGIADELASFFKFGDYYFHVFQDWCKGFRGILESKTDPTWDCDDEPNYTIISTVLEEVKSKLTKENVGTLFETSVFPRVNPRLKSQYRIETIKAKLKTPTKVRKAILKDFFKNRERVYQNDYVGRVAITRWIEAVRPMFESSLDNRNDWEKVLFFIDTISQHPDSGMLDERREVRSGLAAGGLPARLGIHYRPDSRVQQAKERGRFPLARLFTSHSLGEHHRIGRRQAAMRGIDTLGDAQDGGLLLA
ncbi:hypothetical protein JCM5353_003829 [Sporobolomyces roseus]